MIAGHAEACSADEMIPKSLEPFLDGYYRKLYNSDRLLTLGILTETAQYKLNPKQSAVMKNVFLEAKGKRFFKSHVICLIFFCRTAIKISTYCYIPATTAAKKVIFSF